MDETTDKMGDAVSKWNIDDAGILANVSIPDCLNAIIHQNLGDPISLWKDDPTCAEIYNSLWERHCTDRILHIANGNAVRKELEDGLADLLTAITYCQWARSATLDIEDGLARRIEEAFKQADDVMSGNCPYVCDPAEWSSDHNDDDCSFSSDLLFSEHVGERITRELNSMDLHARISSSGEQISPVYWMSGEAPGSATGRPAFKTSGWDFIRSAIVRAIRDIGCFMEGNGISMCAFDVSEVRNQILQEWPDIREAVIDLPGDSVVEFCRKRAGKVDLLLCDGNVGDMFAEHIEYLVMFATACELLSPETEWIVTIAATNGEFHAEKAARIARACEETGAVLAADTRQKSRGSKQGRINGDLYREWKSGLGYVWYYTGVLPDHIANWAANVLRGDILADMMTRIGGQVNDDIWHASLADDELTSAMEAIYSYRDWYDVIDRAACRNGKSVVERLSFGTVSADCVCAPRSWKDTELVRCIRQRRESGVQETHPELTKAWALADVAEVYEKMDLLSVDIYSIPDDIADGAGAGEVMELFTAWAWDDIIERGRQNAVPAILELIAQGIPLGDLLV